MKLIDKIAIAFNSELGQQVDSIYSTSDERLFIRLSEAKLHTNDLINSVGDMEFVDTSILMWVEEWSGRDSTPQYRNYKIC